MNTGTKQNRCLRVDCVTHLNTCECVYLQYVCVCLFVVDSQFEGHPSSEFVSLTAFGQSVGIDFTLHADVGVQRGVQELHGHQRLSVVHLRY